MMMGSLLPLSLRGGAQTVASHIVQRHAALDRITAAVDQSPEDRLSKVDWVEAKFAGAHLTRTPPVKGLFPVYSSECRTPEGTLVRETFQQRGDDLKYARYETADGLPVAEMSYLVKSSGAFLSLSGCREDDILAVEKVDPAGLGWLVQR